MHAGRVPQTLALQALSAAAFLPFGEVIEPAAATREFDINDGQTRRYHDIARAQALQSDSRDAAGNDPGSDFTATSDARPVSGIGFSIFRPQAVSLPFTLMRMERHPLGSQAFINVSNVPFAIVVAPSGPFDVSGLRAFLAAPGQSINYRAGTWHHYLLALGRGDFVVVDRIGEGNCDEIALPAPITLTAV